jgi:PA14 domain
MIRRFAAMKWIAFSVWLGLAFELPARQGLLQTLDGKNYEGEIQLTNGVFHLVQSEPPVNVPLTNLLDLKFEASAPVPEIVTKGSGNGLLGFYFNNTNASGDPVVRLDQAVDFDWGSQAPMRAIEKDNFSVIWMGEVEAPVSGEFKFYISADEAARLSVGDQGFIEHQPQQPVESSVSVALEAGKRYPVKMVYYELLGNARARLSWSGPGIPKSVIPKERLYAKSLLPGHASSITSPPGGLLATFYRNPDFTGNTFSRVDPSIDFNWMQSAPAPGISAPSFSVRWRGQVQADFSEPYTFYTMTDEGVRLWINGKPLITQWQPFYFTELKETVLLDSGEKYDLEFETQSTSGGAIAKLMWSSPSIPKSVIPPSHLFPSKPAIPKNASIETSSRMARGIVMRSGAFIACAVEKATETAVQAPGLLQDRTVSLVNVARIVWQPLPKSLLAKVQPGRTGVLLANGDFIDGEFRGLDKGRLQLSSILFGLRSYEAARDVTAVVLNEVTPTAAQYEIQLQDRSILFAVRAKIENENLVIEDPFLGTVQVPASDLVTIKRANKNRTAR